MMEKAEEAEAVARHIATNDADLVAEIRALHLQCVRLGLRGVMMLQGDHCWRVQPLGNVMPLDSLGLMSAGAALERVRLAEVYLADRR